MPSRCLALALVAVVAFAPAAACSEGARHYGSDTRGAFMESCTVKQQQPQAICACTYEEITQQIPFDRYIELDKELQKDPKAVPDELLRIVADCGSRLSSSSASSSSSDTSSSSESTSSGSTSSSSSSSGSSSSSSSSVPASTA